MSQLWNAAAAIGALGAVPLGVVALLLARKANNTAKEAAADSRRLVQIEEAAEHERLRPQLVFKLEGALPGNGYEVTVSTDRSIDSLALSIVRGVDDAADSSIMGVTDGVVPGPVGTLSAHIQLPAMAAGTARRLALWTSDPDRAAGATVRFRGEARRSDRVWSDLLNDVSIPGVVLVK